MPFDYFLYVGSAKYDTAEFARHVYLCEFESDAARLVFGGVAATVVNPGFLAVSPDERFLFVESEVAEFKGTKSGGISSFAVDQRTGELMFLSDRSSEGRAPAFLSLDRNGRHLFTVNYHSGSVAVFPIGSDGRLGEASAVRQSTGSSAHPTRQLSSHPHSVYVCPGNRFLLVPDLGLDRVLIYRFDARTGVLTPNDPPYASVTLGSGPRHLAFAPDLRFAYVLNELHSSITVFAFDALSGTLEKKETISALPSGFRGENLSAEIEVARSGKVMYVSNRGNDSIAVFSLEPETGQPALIEHISCGGKTPRFITTDPTGSCLLVANQDSGNVAVFRIHQQTGRLSPSAESIAVPDPVCIAFVRRLV